MLISTNFIFAVQFAEKLYSILISCIITLLASKLFDYNIRVTYDAGKFNTITAVISNIKTLGKTNLIIAVIFMSLEFMAGFYTSLYSRVAYLQTISNGIDYDNKTYKTLQGTANLLSSNISGWWENDVANISPQAVNILGNGYVYPALVPANDGQLMDDWKESASVLAASYWYNNESGVTKILLNSCGTYLRGSFWYNFNTTYSVNGYNSIVTSTSLGNSSIDPIYNNTEPNYYDMAEIADCIEYNTETDGKISTGIGSTDFKATGLGEYTSTGGMTAIVSDLMTLTSDYSVLATAIITEARTYEISNRSNMNETTYQDLKSAMPANKNAALDEFHTANITVDIGQFYARIDMNMTGDQLQIDIINVQSSTLDVNGYYSTNSGNIRFQALSIQISYSLIKSNPDRCGVTGSLCQQGDVFCIMSNTAYYPLNGGADNFVTNELASMNVDQYQNTVGLATPGVINGTVQYGTYNITNKQGVDATTTITFIVTPIILTALLYSICKYYPNLRTYGRSVAECVVDEVISKDNCSNNSPTGFSNNIILQQWSLKQVGDTAHLILCVGDKQVTTVTNSLELKAFESSQTQSLLSAATNRILNEHAVHYIPNKETMLTK